MMDELTEPEDWNFEPLKDLDRLLRCSICFEYFKTAMMMPNCSHNYCSLCIRKHLQNRQLCPMCSKPVMESQLQCNRLIDNLVNSFKSNRNAFMSLLANMTKNGLTTPSTIAMATTTAAVVGGASLSSPLRVPQPPSASGTSILDLTDSELSQGLANDISTMDTHDTSRTAAVRGPAVQNSMIVNDEGGRCVKERRSSSSGGGALSSPSVSSCPTATKAVVTAIVHQQTPGHSRANKTPSRKLSEGLSKKSQKVGSGESSRGREKIGIADVAISSGSGGVSGAEPQASTARDNVATPTNSNNLKVACPVCQVEIFEKFINTHLDKCLKPTTPTSFHASHTSSSSSSPRLKRLPKLVFSVMTDKQLRKQLKEYHLSTQGKRDMLLKRIKEFTLLYNAECDALNPRTMKEVAQEVERAERSKLVGGSIASRKGSTPSSSSSSSSSTTSLPPPPQSSRKSSDSEITEMREQYVKAHDDHFSKLIADVRVRETKRRSSSSASSDAVTTPTNPGNVSIHKPQEQSDSSVSPAEVKDEECPPQGNRIRPHTSSGDGVTVVRDQDDRVLLDQELEEDSQFVFASDSPSPPFLGRGEASSSYSRRLLEETTSIPESPTSELKATPASRKRASNRNKRSSAISLATLYQDKEDAVRFAGDEDPDFLPSNVTPFKTRKKQKRY